LLKCSFISIHNTYIPITAHIYYLNIDHVVRKSTFVRILIIKLVITPIMPFDHTHKQQLNYDSKIHSQHQKTTSKLKQTFSSAYLCKLTITILPSRRFMYTFV